MGSVDKRPNGQFRARWREYPNGPQKTRQFRRKVDADRFLTEIEHAKLTGTYVSPQAGQVTVEEYASDYQSRRSSWRVSTRDRVEWEMRHHILPTLGRRPLSSLTTGDIERWAAALPLAPSSVATVHGTLSALLSQAVEDGRLVRNPAKYADLPKREKAPFVTMSAEDVGSLVLHAPLHVRAGIVLAAGTGLR